MELTRPLIDQSKLPNICEEYKDAYCPYMDLLDSEGRYYPVKNFLFFNQDEYFELVSGLDILNSRVMKKTVFHIMERSRNDIGNYYSTMARIGFTKKMADVVLHAYNKYAPRVWNEFPITYYGRFDVLVNEKGEFKIVEQNSETPAGLPECINSPILAQNARAGTLNGYVDVNEGFEARMYRSFEGPINAIRNESLKKQILLAVAFSNDNTSMHDVLYRSVNAVNDELKIHGLELKVLDTTIPENKEYALSRDEFYFREMANGKVLPLNDRNVERLVSLNKAMFDQVNRFLDIVPIGEGNISELQFTDGEDYNNSLRIASFFKAQFLDFPNVEVQLIDVADIEVNRGKDIYYRVRGVDTKIDYLYTFYPQEWYFLDDEEDNGQFWDKYLKDSFVVLNNPLTLVTQSKAFWAYLYENINDIGFDAEEKAIVEKYVPKYYFNPMPNTISKPLFFREGSGIGDPNFVGQMVYQDLIDQKIFTANEFPPPPNDPNGPDGMDGYLTIGLYFGEDYGSGKAYIGNYTRICKNKITDFLAYYLPVIINESPANNKAP